MESKDDITTCQLPSSPPFSEDTNLLLLLLIRTEINRDGGTSYINSLKNYSSSPKITTLLKKRNGGAGGGVTAFLQHYPDVFEVDTSQNRHRVILKDMEECTSVSSSSCSDEKELSIASSLLEDRAVYLLRQRYGKLARRLLRDNNDDDDAKEQIPAAPLEWLARKAMTELHRYVRLLGERRPVNCGDVGSEQWWNISMDLFYEFLKDKSHAFLLSKQQHDPKEKKKGYQIQLASDNNSAFLTHAQVEQIASTVIQLVSDDSPNVGGMDVGMLLKDAKLRLLLGGRDLIRIMEQKPVDFNGVELFRDEDTCELRIALSYKEDDDNDDDESVATNTLEDHGRLAADDVGHFSVTASKTAIAMANCLATALLHSIHNKKNATQQQQQPQPQQQQIPKKLEFQNLPADTICIDFTAGVGGNTIACARFFPSVYSFEIDSNRAELCGRNVTARGCQNRVDIRCMNSLEALPQLAARFRHVNQVSEEDSSSRFVYMAAIIDPPWGGRNYRHKRDQEDEGLGLGQDAPLSKVVSMISSYMSPLVLGIKLPPTFDVAIFTEKLCQNAYCGPDKFRVASVKKLKRQLFLVLDIQ